MSLGLNREGQFIGLRVDIRQTRLEKFDFFFSFSKHKKCFYFNFATGCDTKLSGLIDTIKESIFCKLIHNYILFMNI